ncbi:MAG: recombination protein RecR [Deltaproteobacteria bacterium RBG_19FT_COMBO_46_12]|nr:MAG: recombination protein RecR [Deltaproteobacteria bacterium RBG_19FT_COMBO_46_12]
MSVHAKPIDHLIEALSKLPGIGKKTASRLAFYILRSSPSEAQELAKAISDVKEKIRLCSICFNLTDEDPCRICQDERRSQEVLCVVEGPNDLIAIENTSVFNGTYHVLHGAISPLEGVGPDSLKIKELMERLQKEKFCEVILATNPTVEGGATALYLTDLIKSLNIKVTRIAYGIPMGSEIEYSDGMTLSKALEGRREI